MDEITLHLSGSKGGASNKNLINWDPTWDQFCKRVTQVEIGQKDGSYFVRGPFGEDHTRANPNIPNACLVVLDGDSRIDPETGELYESAPHPSLVHEALRDLDILFIIYTTHSHGADGKGNRYRVVIPVELETPEQLRAVVDWLIDQLHKAGVPLAPVKENYSWSQPWYLPRIRANDAEFLTYHHDTDEALDLPVIMDWWHAQQPLEPNIAPETASRSRSSSSPIGRYNAQHGTADAQSEVLAQHGYVFVGTGTINGEVSYRFRAPGSTSGNAGVVLFHTKAGILRVVSHHGEHDPLAQQDTKTGRALCHDAFDLLRILKHKGDTKAAIADVKRLRDESPQPDHVPEQQVSEDPTAIRNRMLSEFNCYHAVAVVESKAVIIYWEKDRNSGDMVTRFMSAHDAGLKYKPLKVPVEGKNTIEYKSLFSIWLEMLNRRTYDQIYFEPKSGLVCGDIRLPDTKNLNLYQGLALKPCKGDCSKILNHIKEVWCAKNDAAYDYVIKVLARMFQCPAERGHVVIVLKSIEGAGKNIIVDILVNALGYHAFVATRPEDLTGRFNDHLAVSVLVFANEALWGGDKTQEGALKALITDERLTVERKYLPRFHVKNCTHLIVASNNDWAVPVGIRDRRFFVLEVSEHRAGDFEYFGELSDHISNGGAEAFIQHLLNKDILDFNPRDMPELNSGSKIEMKMRGADSVTRWWADCLFDGEI